MSTDADITLAATLARVCLSAAFEGVPPNGWAEVVTLRTRGHEHAARLLEREMAFQAMSRATSFAEAMDATEAEAAA